MIERSCEIVQIPGGGIAALMPLADVPEKHWVAVDPGANVLRATGHVHRQTMSWRIAHKPWDESWTLLGTRPVILIQPDVDYDLGGGD